MVEVKEARSVANKYGPKTGVRVSGVACKECGAYCDHLPTHIRYSHGMEMVDYIAKHPDTKNDGINAMTILKDPRTKAEIDADSFLARLGRPYEGTAPLGVKGTRKTQRKGRPASRGRGED